MVSFPSAPDDIFKAYAYEQLAIVGKALCAPARLVILNVLCQGERSVEVLAGHAGLTVANASQHLQVLRTANLVESERRGNKIIYKVTDRNVVAFYTSLKELAVDRMSNLKRAFDEISSAPSRLKQVGREELLEKVKAGAAVVIDVRPEEEYRTGHVPGAISIPLDRLEEELGRLPLDKEIVALCRGEYCILADKAIALMRKRGMIARRAADGVVEWELAGLPLESGDQPQA
jgi:rhodanese-related sulfurtransferase